MLVLSVLSGEERHGYDIAKRIEIISKNALKIGHGSLYPALYRLQKNGLVSSRKGQSKEGRELVLYSLTDTGAEEAQRMESDWKAFARSVNLVLRG